MSDYIVTQDRDGENRGTLIFNMTRDELAAYFASKSARRQNRSRAGQHPHYKNQYNVERQDDSAEVENGDFDGGESDD